jgi:hypothetical protein
MSVLVKVAQASLAVAWKWCRLTGISACLRQDGTKWSASSRDRGRGTGKPGISRETSPFKKAYFNYILYLCLMLIVDYTSNKVV